MAIGQRAVYFLRCAVDAMVRAPRIALAATLTIAVAVALIGLFAGVLRGGERLLAAWAGEVQISAYLDPSANLEDVYQVAVAVAHGRKVEAVSAQQALERFRASLGAQGALLDGVGPEVIPASVEVSARGLRVEEARALAHRLEAISGVREVDFGDVWLDQLQRFLRRLRWIGTALFTVLALGAAVLVANTLRLGVFARRDAIEIMKLVGATDRFVVAPFLIEGIFEGVTGGALAAGGLTLVASQGLPRLAMFLGWAHPLTRAELVPGALIGALVAGGGALGLLASALAVRRELGSR